MTEGNGEVRKLPNSWICTYLGNIGIIVAGGTPSTKIAEYWSDEVPWVSPADLSGYTKKFISRGRKSLSKLGLESSSAQLMPSGSILFSSRAPIGYVVIAANEICTNQGFKSLVPSKGIFNEYVYYYLKRSKHLAEDYASGTTFKELSAKSFSILPIPLPPFNEQKRIVEKIEELFSDLDQGIESLKKARKQLKVYRQAVLKWAFEGKLTEKWRSQIQQEKLDIKTGEELLAQIKAERENRYQQQLAEWKEAVREWEAIGKLGKKPIKPQQSKDFPSISESDLSELPYLPDNWIYVAIDILLASGKKGMTTGPFGTLMKKSDHKGTGIPVLGIENIGDGVFIPGNKIFVSEEKAKGLASFEVSGGDIIISRSGTVGEICCVPEGIGLSLISTNLMRLSLEQTIIISKFFVYLFQGGGTVKEQVKELCKGSTRDFLNQNIIKSIKFPLPSFKEQDQIVQEIESRLSICDQLEATIIENLQKAEALRQSILKQAFEGKLVPQDPNDEPAEKLLERIKQEKIKVKKGEQLSIQGI